MSNPHACRSSEPPTPSKNFSHPNRQRDPSLSPEINQDNALMTPNDSRHMLPILHSRVFSRSTSNISLQTQRDAHADFDFGHQSTARPETSHTAFSSYSTPDLNATALPQISVRDAPPIPPIPQRYRSPASAPVTINAPCPRRSQTKSAKSAKNSRGSTWDRWKMRVETAFRFGRKKKLQISVPNDFRHERTYGGGALRVPGTGVFTLPASRTPAPDGAGGTSVMTTGGLGGGGLGQKPSRSHGARTGTAGAESSGGGTYAGLGHQDTEGTAVSDDGDSEWEDEATRTFRGWDENQNRRE